MTVEMTGGGVASSICGTSRKSWIEVEPSSPLVPRRFCKGLVSDGREEGRIRNMGGATGEHGRGYRRT